MRQHEQGDGLSTQSAGHPAPATVRLSAGRPGRSGRPRRTALAGRGVDPGGLLAPRPGTSRSPGAELTTSAGPPAGRRSIEQLEVDHGDVLVVALDGTPADRRRPRGGSAAAAAGAGTGLLSGRARVRAGRGRLRVRGGVRPGPGARGRVASPPGSGSCAWACCCSVAWPDRVPLRRSSGATSPGSVRPRARVRGGRPGSRSGYTAGTGRPAARPRGRRPGGGGLRGARARLPRRRGRRPHRRVCSWSVRSWRCSRRRC